MRKLTIFIMLLIMTVSAGNVAAQESVITFVSEKQIGSIVSLWIYTQDPNMELSGISGELVNGGWGDYILDSQTVTIKGNIEQFNCGNTAITSLTLSNVTNLKVLGCQKNKLSSLDLSGVPNITRLSIANNKLEAINLAPTQKLEEVYCQMNKIKDENMTNLVNNLPNKVNGRLYVITTNDAAEQNVITASDIAIANSKGWGVYYRNSGSDNGPYTDIESVKMSQLSVYPSIATDVVTLEVPTNLVGTGLNIISADGRTVFSSIIENPKTTVSLSNLANGIYWIKVGNHTQKFIKQ